MSKKVFFFISNHWQRRNLGPFQTLKFSWAPLHSTLNWPIGMPVDSGNHRLPTVSPNIYHMHLVWHVVSSVQYLNQSPSKVKIPSQLKKWQSHYILKLLFLNWLHVSLFMFWIADKSRCKSELDLTQPSNYICSLVAKLNELLLNLIWLDKHYERLFTLETKHSVHRAMQG